MQTERDDIGIGIKEVNMNEQYTKVTLKQDNSDRINSLSRRIEVLEDRMERCGMGTPDCQPTDEYSKHLPWRDVKVWRDLKVGQKVLVSDTVQPFRAGFYAGMSDDGKPQTFGAAWELRTWVFCEAVVDGDE